MCLKEYKIKLTLVFMKKKKKSENTAAHVVNLQSNQPHTLHSGHNTCGSTQMEILCALLCVAWKVSIHNLGPVHHQTKARHKNQIHPVQDSFTNWSSASVA